MISVAWLSEPDCARLIGPENIGPERLLPRLLAPGPVNCPSRITLENNGKIRPQPDRENAFARASGGVEGIRTLDTVSRIHAFQACAFDHSATSPYQLTQEMKSRVGEDKRTHLSE